MNEPNALARELFAGRRVATLATRNEDDSIHLTPVWFIFEAGQLFVGTNSGSRKARNIEARGTATLLIDTRSAGTERWASASGRAEIVRGAEAAEINARILRRYLTMAAIEDPRVGPAFGATDDVTIRIRPDTWRSWNSKELDAQYFGGILTATPGKWFLPLE